MSKYKTCFYICLIVFLIERKLICRHGKFTVSFATLQRSARFLLRRIWPTLGRKEGRQRNSSVCYFLYGLEPSRVWFSSSNVSSRTVTSRMAKGSGARLPASACPPPTRVQCPKIMATRAKYPRPKMHSRMRTLLCMIFRSLSRPPSFVYG